MTPETLGVCYSCRKITAWTRHEASDLWVCGSCENLQRAPAVPDGSPLYSMALDLGQLQDFSTIAIIEAIPTSYPPDDEEINWDLPAQLRGELLAIDGPPCLLNLRWLQRIELGTSYPDVVRLANGVWQSIPPARRILSLDATGVGRPVVDMFGEAGLETWNITITGGQDVGTDEFDPHEISVPKRDIVHGLLIGLQQKRFRISARLPYTNELVKELTNFRAKINQKTGHDTYEAWREAEHDDIVLGVSIAAWVAERMVETYFEQEVARRKIARMREQIHRPISPL